MTYDPYQAQATARLAQAYGTYASLMNRVQRGDQSAVPAMEAAREAYEQEQERAKDPLSGQGVHQAMSEDASGRPLGLRGFDNQHDLGFAIKMLTSPYLLSSVRPETSNRAREAWDAYGWQNRMASDVPSMMWHGVKSGMFGPQGR